MAIAHVQHPTRAATAGSGTTQSKAFASNNTAGNLLVAVVSWATTDRTPTVSDSQGNTWTEIGTHFYDINANIEEGLAMFYAKNCKAGANTVTVNYGGTCTDRVLVIAEFSGADTSNPLDGTAGQGSTNDNLHAGSGSNNATSTAITPSVDGCLLLGACVVVNINPTIANGTGFTSLDSLDNFDTFVAQEVEYMIQGTKGSQAATFTTDEGNTYHARVAVFKPAAAGGGAFTLEAGGGSYSVTGTAATLKLARKLTIGSGSYSITGTAAVLRKASVLAADGGSYTLTGTAASLLYNRVLIADPGEYEVTGSDATLTGPDDIVVTSYYRYYRKRRR